MKFARRKFLQFAGAAAAAPAFAQVVTAQTYDSDRDDGVALLEYSADTLCPSQAF
jgi:hypothetical protein